jgi:hypothetical protein
VLVVRSNVTTTSFVKIASLSELGEAKLRESDVSMMPGLVAVKPYGVKTWHTLGSEQPKESWGRESKFPKAPSKKT